MVIEFSIKKNMVMIDSGRNYVKEVAYSFTKLDAPYYS